MIHWIRGSVATCQFELARSLTPQRLAVSILLTLFPGAMMLILIRGPQLVSDQMQDPVAAALGFPMFATVFLTSLVCLLTLLLWAPSNIHSELENKSWSYLASRPGGRIACYLGKYLTSALVSFIVSVLALSICLGICSRLLAIEDPIDSWFSLVLIFLLASFVYAAVFSMIGTLLLKRAMVIAAAYLIVSEVFLATLPAVINKLTVRFHLQTLGISWLGWFIPESKTEFEALYGFPWPDWLCLVTLGIIGLTCLIIGAIVVTHRQYVTSDET